MRKFLGTSARCVLLFLVAVGLTSCERPPATSHQEVVFGAVLPMTGSAAQYGEEARQGIDLAIEWLARDTLNSPYRFRYDLQDSETNPRTAESALRVLKSKHDLFAIISEVSGVVLALAPICERDSIVQMNVGAQNPQIAGSGRFTFSLINLADVESKQAAEFAYQNLGKRRAAILFAAASYGQGARDVFVPTFTALGGTIVAEASYPVEATDYRAQIAQIRRAQPDVVYLPGTTQDMARVLRQSYEAGFQPQWLSYTAFEGPEILELAGPAAEGVIFVSPNVDWTTVGGRQAQFRDAFQARYSRAPSPYSATAFDAVMLLAQAVRSVGPSGPQVRDYLSTSGSYEGVSGRISFDSRGAVNKPLGFKMVQDSAFVEYTSPTPVPE